ncbi:MAG: hypothetical protein WC683_14315 [bacterium]
MLKKKARAKEARVDTPVEELNQKETLMHYNAVLIEDQNSKFRLVLERMDVLTTEVRENSRDMKALRTSHDESNMRLSNLELVFRGLKDDILDMERRICSKINRITERCEKHDCRLTALEANQ